MSIGLEFRFPAGRYHATPWGSHVNEAEVEWPPSPWRILRGLIATWHRKVDPDRFEEEILENVVHGLSAVSPTYRLPTASHAHSRHYMPERKGRGERKTLVFDAFLRIDPDDPLVVVWSGVELDPSARELLSTLAERMGYLGRAESWIEGEFKEGWSGALNCRPADDTPQGEGTRDGEEVFLAAAIPAEDYRRWRNEKVSDLGLTGKLTRKRDRELLATLPLRLLDALRLDTGAIQKQGWSRAPGMKSHLYRRPEGSLLARPGRGESVRGARVRPTTARLILYRAPAPSSPLPRLVNAVKIGEVARWAAIRSADDASAETGAVPSVLTGHGMPDGNVHQHAFYLPEDADGDGRIERILVHADAGLGTTALSALSRLRRLWLDEGAEWRVLLEEFGDTDTFADHPYLTPARVWRSVTPYLHPWYRKKGFQHEEQLVRECRQRGWPEPDARRRDSVEVRGRELRPVHFHRFRSRRGLRQPDTRGSFWELRFPTPVVGPVALGFGCHYGLGVFRAVDT